MKRFLWSVLSVLFISFFLKAGCSKEDELLADLPAPNTDQYITWNFGSNQGQLTAPPNTLSASNTFGNTFIGGNNGSGSMFGIYFNGSTTGTYPGQIHLRIGSKEYNSNHPTNIIVTQYGTTGGYVQGSYSGRLKDTATAETFDVRGLFRAKLQ
jgi:hypothetical protein